MDTQKSHEEQTQGQVANGHVTTPEEKKPIIDQMTDLVAHAAGALAEVAVKTVAKKARKAVSQRIPASVKKAADRVVKASKASKKTVKKSPKKSKTSSKKTKSSAGRKAVGTKKSAKKATKKTKGKKSKR